uniref:chitinase n=1 Tax=Ciona intestinalis TaxID=7719 RepID=F7AAC8_CIOIN|nr:uncharacterized protein LOC100186095 isoform X1 [Ciona intestinalis]|eukprot:XP_002131788.1 uncharacterized protein LOC100186095 isoform X1 [Ciona intestinalis]
MTTMFQSVFLVTILAFVGVCRSQDSDCVTDGKPISAGPSAIEGDCENYYVCSNGYRTEVACPEGLAFDPVLGICNYPRSVKGCQNVDGIDATDYYCYDKEGNFVVKKPFPKPGTCDTFYECLNAQLTERKCPGGLVFKPDSMLCDNPSDPPDCIPSLTTVFPDINVNPSATILPQSTTEPATPIPTVLPSTTVALLPTTGITSPVTEDNSGLNTSHSASTTDHGSTIKTSPTTITTHPPTETTFPPTTVPITHDPPFETTFPPTTIPITHDPPFDTTTSPPKTTHLVSTTTPQKPAPTFVGFVVDDTGSMYNEIVAVKEWISNCVDGSYASCANAPTGGWVLTTFNDPADLGELVGPTTDVSIIISAIGDLHAHGGGDCPEYSMTGIQNAAKVIPKENGGCKIFFFTDATAKDGSLLDSTLQLYKDTNCVFIPMLTGCCHECEDPCISQDPEYCTNFVTDNRGTTLSRKKRSYGARSTSTSERLYYDLAGTTGGAIYLTDKPSTPDEMLEFLEDEVTLGFCPSEELAGPPPFGYTTEHDCNITGSCWDRSVGKCYCPGAPKPCPKEPLYPECKDETEHSYMPDVTDCTKYYQCSSGNIWRRECAPGTVFDPDVGVCNHDYLTAPPCGTLGLE